MTNFCFKDEAEAYLRETVDSFQISHCRRLDSPPRSNAHARLRPYTSKYGRRDRILPYFNGIPGSVLRSYFSVSFTEGYDHFRVEAKFALKHHCTRSPCSSSGIGRIQFKTTSYFLSNGSYTIMNDRIRHGELRSKYQAYSVCARSYTIAYGVRNRRLGQAYDGRRYTPS